MSNVKKQIKIVKKGEALFIEQLLPGSEGSLYGLARIAMLRALELASGKPPLIENFSLNKETTIALEEIAQGKINIVASSVPSF